MNYGVLGTGPVGQTIASKLIALGHKVWLGSRTKNNEKAHVWAEKQGKQATAGTFAEAAAFGKIIFCCVMGFHALEALKAAGTENLAGKILIDVSNPYHYQGGHISLDPDYCGTTSLGEKIQAFLPTARVVKTLNYIGADLMVQPERLPEAVTGFYCGNDIDAKNQVACLLKQFGWQDTFDLGDISMSRYTEMLGAFWIPVYGQLGNMEWGLRLVRPEKKTTREE